MLVDLAGAEGKSGAIAICMDWAATVCSWGIWRVAMNAANSASEAAEGTVLTVLGSVAVLESSG